MQQAPQGVATVKRQHPRAPSAKSDQWRPTGHIFTGGSCSDSICALACLHAIVAKYLDQQLPLKHGLNFALAGYHLVELLGLVRAFLIATMVSWVAPRRSNE